MRLEPFDYQLKCLDELRAAFHAKQKRALVCMLMGGGKSITALELMRLTSEKGNRALFLCDRRMLAEQIVEVAQEQGLDAGIIMAGRGMDLRASCQFASKQTIVSWLKRGKIQLPEFQLVVIDEAHRAVSEDWDDLRKRWPNAFFIGLTATPCLGNGNGMGHYYDILIQPIQPSGLKELGRIVPCRAFAPHVPDLKGVKKDKDGDYSAKSLSERMNRANLIGDVPGWWKKLAENRPSIYFACDIAHGLSIRDEFRANGVAAELICEETPDEERADIRRQLKNGQLQVVVNCDVLAEGIDWPFVSCIGLVRPTKRLRRYLQNAGRGMRAFEGKKDCLIIDHAGCVLYHGFPDIDRVWPLSPDDNVDRANEKKQKESKPMMCAKCSAIFSGTNVCPECGHTHVKPRVARDYGQRNGNLVEVTGGDLDSDTSRLLMNRFWQTCIGTAIKRGRTAGMAAGMFSGRFKMPPWEAGVSPLPGSGSDWKRPARDVFPGFVRRRAE